jgi:sialic acid synthase SpsE
MVKFISEISSNHNRDKSRMLDFIQTSAEIGCSAVKFQLFKIEELFAKEILTKSKSHRSRKLWELEEELIPFLNEACKKNNIEFGCTPFYSSAVDKLKPYVDFLKIASYELLWKELFFKCGNSGIPVMFSIGMANQGEVSSSLKWLLDTSVDEITVLHCNSAYPTPIEDSNLGAINSLNNLVSSLPNPGKKNINIGYSDHTVSQAVMYRAIHKYDAKVIEFHIDLDGKGEEFESGHCWLPKNIAEVIRNINIGLDVDGEGKIEPTKSEMPDRDWRADPKDGLRPLKKIRKAFSG